MKQITALDQELKTQEKYFRTEIEKKTKEYEDLSQNFVSKDSHIM